MKQNSTAKDAKSQVDKKPRKKLTSLPKLPYWLSSALICCQLGC